MDPGGDPLTPTDQSLRWLPLIFVIMGGIVLIDQLTKLWATRALTPGVPIEVLGNWLQLNLVRNAGAAFSMGAGFTLIMSLIAVAVVAVIVRFARRIGSLWWALMLGALLGGAVGNLIDRLFQAPGPLRGHVIDFIQIPYWPIFNFADIAIVVAIVLMIVLAWRGVPLGGQVDRDPRRSVDR